LYAYTAVSSIDTTAIEGLLETKKILEMKAIQVSHTFHVFVFTLIFGF